MRMMTSDSSEYMEYMPVGNGDYSGSGSNCSIKEGVFEWNGDLSTLATASKQYLLYHFNSL